MSLSDDAKLEADIRGQTYPRGGDVGAFMRLLDHERAKSKRTVEAFQKLYEQAQILSMEMEVSPGGDQYIFTGSVNVVVDLRDMLSDLRTEFGEILYGPDGEEDE